MAKFCGMCGTPLEEGWIACPKCAHKIPEKKEEISKIQATPEVQVAAVAPAVPEAEAVRVTYVSEANIFAPPLHQEVETTAESEPQKPKKRKALKITAIVLAVLIVAGSVFGVWWVTKPRYITAGADPVAFSNRYGDFYYSASNLFNMDRVEDGPVEFEYSSSFTAPYFYDSRNGTGVMVKDSMYVYTGYMDSSEAMEWGKRPDNSKIKYPYGIYKVDFIGETEIETELWLTPEELCEYPEFDNGSRNSYNLMFMQYSDNYIYFVTCEQKLARIGMKDKEIEYIDEDIRTMNYVVDGKWIYFAGALEEGSEEVGIYKMKTDGSDMEMLYEFEEPFYVCEYAKLGIYKNRIYFIEHCEDESTIYRMKKNGKKVEEIASGNIWAYTIDEKRDKLYYFECERLDDGAIFENKFYEVSLKDFSSEYLFSLYDGTARGTNLSVNKGKLYVSGGFFVNGVFESKDIKRGDERDRIVGVYYDIKEEELKYLRYHYDGEETEYYWD